MPRTLRRHVSSVVSAFFKLSLSEERNGVMQPVGVCWTHPLYVAIVHPSAVLFSMLKDIELQYNLPNFHLFFLLVILMDIIMGHRFVTSLFSYFCYLTISTFKFSTDCKCSEVSMNYIRNYHTKQPLCLGISWNILLVSFAQFSPLGPLAFDLWKSPGFEG